MTAELKINLSVTDWIVLALIAEEPRHGFSVARELKPGGPIGQIWTVPRPLVYRAFDHLATAQLIEPSGVEPGEKGPVRTVFRITERGTGQINVWLSMPVDHPRDVRVELIAKFIFLARKDLPRSPLANRQLERFGPLSGGLAEKARVTHRTDRIVALWRYESMGSIIRTLETIIAEESACSGETEPTSN